MNRGFIDPWARIPRFIGRLSTSASSHHGPSLAAFITNIVESDFRYTQDCIISTSGYDFREGQRWWAGTGEIQLNCSLAVLEWPVSEQTGGSPCRRLKKEIRKKRNRKRTRTSLRPMCRLTRRRKARASRPSTRSRERPEARFGCKGRVGGSPRSSA